MGKQKNKRSFKFSYFLLPFFYFLFFITINIFSQTSNEVIDEQLQKIFEKYDMTSLSIVVIKNNKTVYKHNFGFQNLETKIKTSDNTYFRVASLTKMFTAALFYKLKNKKKIDFDSDIQDYLGFSLKNPFFPEKKITVLDILMHTSSVDETKGDYIDFIKKTFSDDYSLKDFLNKDGRLYNDKIFSPYFPPGSKHKYSNLGYIILGTVAERVTGIRFDVLMKRYILDYEGSGDLDPKNLPLNRLGTGYSVKNHFHFPEVDNIDSNDCFDEIKKEYKVGTNALPISPQSGLRINLTGLENTLKNLFENKGIFSFSDISYMKTHSIKTSVEGLYQLPGIFLTTNIFPEVKLLGHSGSSFGITSDLYFNMERKTGFAIISSGANLKKEVPQYYKHQREIYDVIYNTLRRSLR